MQNLTNPTLIDSMYADWQSFQQSHSVWGNTYALWQKWVRI